MTAGAEEKPIAPRGPVSYSLLTIPDEQFEAMCHRLVRLEFRNVEKPAKSGDGGADLLLPDGNGGFQCAWQVKHYPKKIHWDACQKSFDDARRNYSPAEYVFIFPRDLQGREIQTFNRRFRSEEVDVEVTYWGHSEMHARLTEDSRGKTVAKHFFGDDGDVIAEIKRTVAAGGRDLESSQDALRQMKPVADFFAVSDPYFSYAGSAFSDDAATKPPEGTVLSISESSEGTTQRIDVVPNDQEAMELHGPKGRISFPSEVSEDAIRALASGQPVFVEKAVLTFDQLPPALADRLKTPIEGEVSFSPLHPAPPAPWDALLSVTQGEEKVDVEVYLTPIEAPEGFDWALEGTWAGMTLKILTRWTGNSGQAEFKYSYSLTKASARDQLKALRFLNLASQPGGTLSIVDRNDPERAAKIETGLPKGSEPLDGLEALLDWIVEIEDWSNVRLPVDSSSFTPENFEAVGRVADDVRNGGLNVTIGQIEFEEQNAGDLDALQEGGPILMRRSIEANLLGVVVPLGNSQLSIEKYDVVELSRDLDRRRRVRVTPQPGHETVFEQLAKPKKRPPQPPRKHAKKTKNEKKRSRRKSGRS